MRNRLRKPWPATLVALAALFGVLVPSSAHASSVTGYRALSPARLLDTRPDGVTSDGAFAKTGPLGGGSSIDVTVSGRGGVTTFGVAAVVLNVTVTGPSQGSHLTVWPSGESRPNTSNLNFTAGQTVPNLVIAKVGAGGKVSIFNNAGTVHVIADVAGWFGSGQATDRLKEGQYLQSGDSLWSPNGQYTLAMQSDGNLVQYMSGKALWSTGTTGNPGAFAVMQPDGNFVVYTKGRVALWSSATSGGPGSAAVLQDDGNFVVYAPGASVQWATYRSPTTISDGQKLNAYQYLRSAGGQYTLLMQGDGNLVLSWNSTPIWSTGTAGHPGAWAVMQSDGNFVVYSATNTPLWTSSTSSAGGFLAVQPDGNLVVYSAGRVAQWSAGSQPAVVPSGQTLAPGQYVSNGIYQLLMQGDGNLVLYKAGAGALWNSGTAGNGGARAVMQGDGNLVVYTPADIPLWNSGTNGNPGAFAQVQQDGNFVVYSAGLSALWATNTAGGSTTPTNSIADKALSYVGQWGGNACRDAGRSGYTGQTPGGVAGDGQCRAFVNCIVLMAKGKWLGGGGGDYFARFYALGATEITSVDQLAKGDIVQIGQYESQSLHTFIIVSRVSGSKFEVVDSNSDGKSEMVAHYPRTVSLGGTVKAFRIP